MRLFVSFIVLLWGTLLFSADVKTTAVNFDNDIIPILTKSGCNTGACHGAAVGRGGFKLSLYGGDPATDYKSIVHELKGRRINFSHPEKSLFVLKPTESISHEGGNVLDIDGTGTLQLLNWIQQGAPRQQIRRLVQLSVSPETFIAKRIGSTFQLKATARFSDGSRKDVTRWTVFTPEDPVALKVDQKTGLVEMLRTGRHVMIARYLNQVLPVEVIVPVSDLPVDFKHELKRNYIDERIIERLTTLRIPTSATIDDAQFLRRLTLDLTGRLPTLQTSQKFLKDPSQKKRDRLINDLLKSEEFNEYWTLRLAQLLRIRSQPQDSKGALAYHRWLKKQISSNVPYDQIARQLILATGDTHQTGAANFYRTVSGARKQAEFTSELFMGNRLRCANCHNHPFDRWTMDDYHGLAAIFAKVVPGRFIKIKKQGEVIHPRTGLAAVPRIPGDQFLKPADDGRVALASWLTNRKNRYFAKAIVNRLWKMMMGRGLVEPTDDLRATNPATHPKLLDQLADDFVKHQYNLRHILRQIAQSSAYQRRSKSTTRNQTDDQFYSHSLERSLPPEVLADAISDIIGIADQYPNQPQGIRAVTLFDGKISSPSLDVLGRCSRKESCETSAKSSGGLTRKLHLINGPLINRRLSQPHSRLAKLIGKGKTSQQIINEFYQRALARSPSKKEQTFWNKAFSKTKNKRQQQELLEDFVWSLLTCQEFVTNH